MVGAKKASTSNYDLLLHFDGTNGSSTITDSGKNGLTLSNYGSTLSTTGQVFGSACCSFSGICSTGVSNVALTGASDFTVRFRLNASVLVGSKIMNVFGHNLWIGDFEGYSYIGVYDENYTNSFTFPITINTQYAVSIERYGATTYLYLDGTQVASGSLSAPTTSYAFGIQSSLGGNVFKIDELMLNTTTALAAGAGSYTVEVVPFL